MKGKVKLYSLVKGTGVIIGEDKREYSVKLVDIVGHGLRRLSEGDVVTFEADGLKAKQVSIVEKE